LITKDYISIKEQNWYFEFYSDTKNESVLILLHHGLGSVAQWKKWPLLLHKKLHKNVLVYDRTGYGKSSLPGSYYPFDYLRYEAKEVLPHIMKALDIQKAHLYGHSDGATIALLAASYAPLNCFSVISEAAHVVIEDISVKGIRYTSQQYPKKLKKILTRFHKDKTDWVFNNWSGTWLNPQFKSWNMLEELKKIEAPVLAIQGEHDEYGSFKQLQIIKKYANAKIIELPDCGHYPHNEKSEKVLNTIRGFFDERIKEE
jgi:pimeloyl-ACP methyl ester carboxylesterase